MASAEGEDKRGLQWALSLLQQPDLDSEQIAQLCRRLTFDLNDALVSEGWLAIRLRLLEAACAKKTPEAKRDNPAAMIGKTGRRVSRAPVAHSASEKTSTVRWP